MKMKTSLFDFTRLFLGELASIHLCKSNAHAFKQLTDKFQAHLETFFRKSVSSMLKRTSVNPMILVDHQQCSRYKKLSYTEVRNDMHLGGHIVSAL